MKGWCGLGVYETQHLPIYIHLQAMIVKEGGLNMRVTYQMNFFPDKSKPRSNISRTASVQGLTILLCPPLLLHFKKWREREKRAPHAKTPLIAGSLSASSVEHLVRAHHGLIREKHN